jgi:dihydroorotate dehydrogenase (NAD+) catalytic subunit
MIDLAPHHKSGLPVANPILLAAGTIGYGEARHSGSATEALGGVVVGPILLRSRGGTQGPRLAELNGGFVLETGQQNRGLHSVVRQFAPLWPRLGCPVIAQLADEHPDAVAKVAARLAALPALSGLEIALPHRASVEQVRQLVRGAMRDSDLPVWVKLPLMEAPILAPVAAEAGAVGLVIGQPPFGSALRRNTEPAVHGVQMTERLLTGSLYGPLSFALTLNALQTVVGLSLPVALIVCGGIYTVEQMDQALAAGANAVQIDAALWAEPGLPMRLVAHWRTSQTDRA